MVSQQTWPPLAVSTWSCNHLSGHAPHTGRFWRCEWPSAGGWGRCRSTATPSVRVASGSSSS
eukprot:11542468-Prorocentrum_lima.AAC.1